MMSIAGKTKALMERISEEEPSKGHLNLLTKN
jgi:hypothetical protein